MTVRIIRGLGALVLIVLLLGGIPWGLWTVAGSPVPSTVPDLSAMVDRLMRPDVTGVVVLTVVKYAGWIAWATFALAVLVEVPARVRGVPAPRLRGFRLQQMAAGALVAAVVTMLTVAPVLQATAAHAATPSAPSVSHSAPAVVTPDASAEAQASAATSDRAQAPVAEAESASAPTFTYVVQQGDSLWKIAEAYLGSGDRFPEIAQLNYGVPQPGGYALDGSHWIDPGWTLTVPGVGPGAVEAPTQAAAGIVQHVVQAGDTLWELAEDHLGDGHRFTEILEASRDIVQPDGGHLTDPRGLLPGWTVNIPVDGGSAPTAQPVAQVVAPTPDDAPATVAPTLEISATAVHHAPVDGNETPAEDRAGAEDQSDAVVLATVAGIGAATAVGILALLAARRRRAERRRAPGERVALPEPGTAPAVLEDELREAADPVGVERMDAALRALAASHAARGTGLPTIRAARMFPAGIELYLDEPATLPQPWQGTPDRLVWQLDAAAAAALGDAYTGAAPYPALVTLGQDAEGAHVLVDLEHVGLLHVSGDEAGASAAAAGLAIELATGPWADDLQVTCVGLLDDLEAVLDSGRVRHAVALDEVLEAAERRAAAAASQLQTAGVSHVRDARGRAVAQGMLNPEVLVVGQAPSSAQLDRLNRLAQSGHAVAVVVTAAAPTTQQWAVEVGPLTARAARLMPVGVDLTPQLLDPETYRTLLALLDPGTIALVPGPQWSRGLVLREEPDLDELTRVRAAPEPLDHDQAEDTGAPWQAEGGTGDGEEDGARAAGLTVRVLGPVLVEGCGGGPPASAHLARSVELSAYLALHPAGVGVADIGAALWPGRQGSSRGRVPAAVSRVRRWWGMAPDGREYVIAVRDERRDTELFQTVHVATDWERFGRLVGPDAAHTPTARLAAALTLVRGRPLDAARPYAWSAPLEAEMRAAVLDIAHEVAARAFDDGRPALARDAAAAARCADPADERAWRDGLRAAWACGDHAEVRLLAAAYHDATDRDDHEPDPDTEHLIDELSGRVAA